MVDVDLFFICYINVVGKFRAVLFGMAVEVCNGGVEELESAFLRLSVEIVGF